MMQRKERMRMRKKENTMKNEKARQKQPTYYHSSYYVLAAAFLYIVPEPRAFPSNHASTPRMLFLYLVMLKHLSD